MNAPIIEISYVTRGEEMLWGALLVALTLVIHAIGMVRSMHFCNGFKERFNRRVTFWSGISSVIIASWLITMVHIVEVMMWAGFFQWKHCFVNYSTAVYFSFLEYTTVGSAFNLPVRWRLLEGMIATAGLIGFAWSCGVLLTLAQEFQDQELLRLKQRRVKNTAVNPAKSNQSES